MGYLRPVLYQSVSLKTNQMFPTQSAAFTNPKTCRETRKRAGVSGLRCVCGPLTVCKPTTDEFRRDQRGSWVAAHLFSGALQAEMSRSTSVGFVADLMSYRALAQQQLLTNHMKEKTSVTRKSCKRQKKTGRKSHDGELNLVIQHLRRVYVEGLC